jgi:hypothetical protein
MSTTEATYITHHHQWLPAQPELHATSIHVKVLRQEKGLAYDCGVFAFAASWMRADPHGL